MRGIGFGCSCVITVHYCCTVEVVKITGINWGPFQQFVCLGNKASPQAIH